MITLDSQMVRQADSYIEENHVKFVCLGRRFFEVFSYSRGQNRTSTQIRNLQQMAYSATRFVDIEDFVKNQMNKDSKWRTLGREVLEQLDELRQESERNDSANPEQQLALRLRIARSWARAVVSEYLYQVALDQLGPTGGHYDQA